MKVGRWSSGVRDRQSPGGPARLRCRDELVWGKSNRSFRAKAANRHHGSAARCCHILTNSSIAATHVDNKSPSVGPFPCATLASPWPLASSAATAGRSHTRIGFHAGTPTCTADCASAPVRCAMTPPLLRATARPRRPPAGARPRGARCAAPNGWPHPRRGPTADAAGAGRAGRLYAQPARIGCCPAKARHRDQEG